MFKRRRFPVEIIRASVRWYCKYAVSYRDLTEMILEGGVEVGTSMIMRWIHSFAPDRRSVSDVIKAIGRPRGAWMTSI